MPPGIGTALKPAMELICLARKPLIGTVAANVLAHGTGALNIDGCRVGTEKDVPASASDARSMNGWGYSGASMEQPGKNPNIGRWPANLIHDGSDEVLAAFPDAGANSFNPNLKRHTGNGANYEGGFSGGQPKIGHADSGTAARFFYSSKADAGDRLESKHPTVKPVDLMAYLCRLVTPPGGTVLDPFAGSGTTGMACMREGFDAILIERESEYVADIRRRLAHVHGNDTPLFAQVAE